MRDGPIFPVLFSILDELRLVQRTLLQNNDVYFSDLNVWRWNWKMKSWDFGSEIKMATLSFKFGQRKWAQFYMKHFYLALVGVGKAVNGLTLDCFLGVLIATPSWQRSSTSGSSSTVFKWSGRDWILITSGKLVADASIELEPDTSWKSTKLINRCLP